MALVPLRLLLDHAAEKRLWHSGPSTSTIWNRCSRSWRRPTKTDSPVILQAPPAGARQYAGENFLRHLILAAVETYPGIPVVNAPGNHGQQPRHLLRLLAANGFTSVMMDGLAGSRRQKLRPATTTTWPSPRKWWIVAHAIGVEALEGELGCLGSLETGKGGLKTATAFDGALSATSCSPIPPKPPISLPKTKVDALANRDRPPATAPTNSPASPPAKCWPSPGSPRFTRPSPNTHLVMHGSSSVPKEWLGHDQPVRWRHPETYGVPVEEIQNGIRNGVRKINIDTDNRLAFTAAVREAAAKDPANFDPRQLQQAGPGLHEEGLP